MTEIHTIAEWIEQAQRNPIQVWPGYDFSTVPFAIYDAENVTYVNHPNPPEERPGNLTAATAVEIGGVQTATLPAFMCVTEQDTVTIAYHEGFHVYQAHHFIPTPADMFTAMAHYPELNPEYRALCRVEADVLNDEGLNESDKLAVSAKIAARRRTFLSVHPSLSAYERFLERSEGTAAYVEQATRQKLYGITPERAAFDSGWSRFYKAGAALCWLFDAALTGWQARIEAGEAISSDLLPQVPASPNDLETRGWAAALDDEQMKVTALRREIETAMQPLDTPAALVLRYPAQGRVFRAFSPNTMISLGDGLILHRTMFTLLLPAHGQVRVEGHPAVDHITEHRLIVPGVPVTNDEGSLRANADGVEIELTGVTRAPDGVFVIGE